MEVAIVVANGQQTICLSYIYHKILSIFHSIEFVAVNLKYY